MPELTWTTALAWFAVLSGAASVAGLVMAVVGTRQQKSLQADVHGAMQTTLGDLGKGFQQTIEAMDRRHQDTFGRLGDILERMDRAAEARYRDLKDRLDGEEAP